MVIKAGTNLTPTFIGYENLGMNEPLPQGPPYYGYTKQEYLNMTSQGIIPKCPSTPTTPTTPTTIPTTSQLETDPGLTGGTPAGYIEGQRSPQLGANPGIPQGPPAGYIEGQLSTHPGDITTPTTSSLEQLTATAVAGVPQLPAYKPTAQLEQLSSQVGGAISDIIEQGGIGIGEETKEKIFLREAEIINASTAQAQRNLEDRMAAQGLSDSGMAFSEGMKLASKSTIAMANVMRDVEIQDSLMKIASYQNALGLGVQFLSYLSEESWRQYQPILYQWQAKVDMYKLAITDAYNKQNLALAHRYDMELSQFQAQTQKELAQMEIDAAAAAAKKKNWWDIAGTGLGILAGVTL